MTPAGTRPGAVLRTRSLTKRYRGGTAVENLDVRLERGRIYGLIGRNGAGKTTLMRMACGLVTPTDGEIELFGHPRAPRQRPDPGRPAAPGLPHRGPRPGAAHERP